MVLSMVPLDHNACYQAICRRDTRFDGHFFTAVSSTGIFCRPSCPARTPKVSNITFYAHAAAASQAGFRPCRRCRPELTPGHPEWNRQSNLVSKALTLIEGGALDGSSVTSLAQQLGVSERHLRRELASQVGASPDQLARSRRTFLARTLLDQTDLPITDVAFSAGFSSVRQFNDTFKATFAATPTSVRKYKPQVEAGAQSTGPTKISLRLPTRGPSGFAALRSFFSRRAIGGLESATDTTFCRGVPGGFIELEAGGTNPCELLVHFTLDCHDHLGRLLPLIRSVTDIDTDLLTIADYLSGDPYLASRLGPSGLNRLPGTFDPFELAVRAVVGQQVSVAGARTTLTKLISLVNAGLVEPSFSTDPSAISYQRFPHPSEILAAPLHKLGITSRRRHTLIDLARAVSDGQLDLGPLADREQAEKTLLSISGVGPWTAGYISMRALANPDGWPVGDLVLRNSLGVSTKELEERCKSWQPWRAYAALTLWASASNKSRRPTQPVPT